VRTGSRDLIMAVALLILMAFSVATGLAGMSVALGAFLAGLLISDSEARHHVEVDLEPFKGLLLGIFFITVGARLDVDAVAADIGWVVLALVLLLAIKAAVLFGAARAFGVPSPVAAEVALLLAQAGEFAFVVIGTARAGDLLSLRVASGAVAVVALSMLVTPLLGVAGRAAARRLERASHGKHAPAEDAAALENHVVIGGFGRVGRLVAEVLEAENVPYIALDTDGDMIAHLRGEHRPVYFGDAGRPELLAKIGAERARAFVVTVGDRRAAERMVTAVRAIQPEAAVFARAADSAHAARLTALGAASVIPVTVEASLQLAGRVLERLELPEETVSQRIDRMRAIELGRLDQAGAPD
jgi:CPA2 family monovalent cation:H+ antiporter-2